MYYKKGLSRVYSHYIDKDNNRIFPDADGKFIRQIQTDTIMLDASDGIPFEQLMIEQGYKLSYPYNNWQGLFMVQENKNKFVKYVSSIFYWKGFNPCIQFHIRKHERIMK